MGRRLFEVLANRRGTHFKGAAYLRGGANSRICVMQLKNPNKMKLIGVNKYAFEGISEDDAKQLSDAFSSFALSQT